MGTSRLHYLRELAEQLRLNGLPESKVREIVAEVEGHVEATGEDPVAAFGQPVDYAARWARLTPRRWVFRVLLGAVVAAGILAGVRTLFSDEPWDGGVPVGASDLMDFGVLFWVLGVLPWTVGLLESRRRASRLGESTIPSVWPLRIAAVVVVGVAAALVAGLLGERAEAPVWVVVPRWTLGLSALVGVGVVFLMGPTPNSSGHLPAAPGAPSPSWTTRVRRAFIND